MKEKLLVLIGRIGKEARVGKIPTKVMYIVKLKEPCKLTPNIKIQILLPCPHTFVKGVARRTC